MSAFGAIGMPPGGRGVSLSLFFEKAKKQVSYKNKTTNQKSTDTDERE
jgi:hypothetical protein